MKKALSCQHMSHVFNTKKYILYFNTKKRGNNHKTEDRGPAMLLDDDKDEEKKNTWEEEKEEKKTKPEVSFSLRTLRLSQIKSTGFGVR